jgi:hypothetical protein
MQIFYGVCVRMATVYFGFCVCFRYNEDTSGKECEELANILICLGCRFLSSKCYYKRRSLNVICQNVRYFVQRWENMQFMPCMKCQFGFVADFVEVNCKGN